MTPTFVLFPWRHMCMANMWLPEAKSSGGWRAVLWGFKTSRSGFKSNLGSHLLSNVQSICFLPSGFFQFFSDFRIWLYSTLVKSVKVKALVPQPCPTVCNPIDFNPPGSSCPWNSPSRNTGVRSHSLLQGIFPTQGVNLCLPQVLHHLSHWGSPKLVERGLKDHWVQLQHSTA